MSSETVRARQFDEGYAFDGEIARRLRARTLVDHSWGNDMTPSVSEPRGPGIDSEVWPVLFVDAADPANSEAAEWGEGERDGRYAVLATYGENVPLYVGDDEAEALRVLAEACAKVRP